jgi:peptidoglycan hydrolase-like protein with peptidoglycan-binding domain
VSERRWHRQRNASPRAAHIAKDTNHFTAGDGADVIRAVQRELGQRGYDPGIPNGVANLVTRGAILAYQHDHGLPLTGEPSEALLKAIVFESSGAFRALGRGMGADQGNHAGRIISTVQQWLSALGYPVGKVDGRMGEDTRRSIREFETQQGLPPTGRISGQLVAELARVSGNGLFAAGDQSALP